MAILGFCVGISGFFIDKSVEANQSEMVRMGFCARSKLVFSEIKEGMKLKELYMTTIFVTLIGTVVPSFGVYFYYY